MNRALRLWRFSLVGAIGIGVQLAVLSALVSLRINYLLATALAVETAVLHNSLWHQWFTWRNRCGSIWGRLVRFHLSNGLISIAGNLLLMRILLERCQLPVLMANVVAIVSCYAMNFLASDGWVFIDSKNEQSRARFTSFGRASTVECVGRKERREAQQ